MSHRPTLTEQHSFINETKFFIKSSLLICLRSLKNTFTQNTPTFVRRNLLKDGYVIAVSSTDLWSKDDNEQNWILTAGKVENLRIAAKKLDGIEVPANTTFSFWKHMGRPSRSRGYVVGREIREGCLVPTVAGGLCQLSNALYDAALKAGFEIIERHKHTKIIKGSLAEIDRDATVKWNYIDLRFRSKFPFRIEVELTSEKLTLNFKSAARTTHPSNNPIRTKPATTLNDCYSCGNFDCFKNPHTGVQPNRLATTTFMLDERWSEYEEYVKGIANATDHFITPFSNHSRIKINRFCWKVPNRKTARSLAILAVYRSLLLRIAAKADVNIFKWMLALDRQIAKQMVKRIPVESTHIVISQNLLPFVWETGALGGRTFDVLMTRLPFETLHRTLDAAFNKYPNSKTLADFRASQTLIDTENTALTKARHIITPHQEIADLFNNKSVHLKWKTPHVKESSKRGNKILFPSSTLGRKGAYEVRQLAKELNLTMVIAGDATEDKFFWQGVKTEKAAANPFEEVQLVVYPPYVEQQPRFLLKAIAAGIPVVITKACGINAREAENIIVVPTGDYQALKQAAKEKLLHLQPADSTIA